jgi:hypothetical protein
VPGNPGGPGNPFARQVAALRQAVVGSVTAEDVQAVASKLLELAKEGNVPAAKLLFAYTIGKPQAGADPDRLEVEEWQYYKETSGMMEEAEVVLRSPAPELPLTLARITRPLVTETMKQTTTQALLHPERFALEG